MSNFWNHQFQSEKESISIRLTWVLMKIVNFNLHEMENLMYPWQPLEGGVDFASIMLCMTSFSRLLLSYENRTLFKFIGWSCALFCPSVCLFECQSPTSHNFKLIFTKFHHVVEFVIIRKIIVFDIKRSTQAKGQQRRWDF